MKQLFTVNLPESRSSRAEAIYYFSDALEMCCNPPNSLEFSSTQLFACHSAAYRRGIQDLVDVKWLSLPTMLERWQDDSVELFSKSQFGVDLDLKSSQLIVELTSTAPMLVEEAIALALAGLALDWDVQLFLTDLAAPILANIAAPPYAKALGSLPIYGLPSACVSEAAGSRLGGDTLLPIKCMTPQQYVQGLNHCYRISL